MMDEIFQQIETPAVQTATKSKPIIYNWEQNSDYFIFRFHQRAAAAATSALNAPNSSNGIFELL